MKIHLWPLFILVVAGMFAMGMITEKAFGFNLIQDVDTQTKWDLGSAVEAGTSVLLKSEQSVNGQAGQFVGSALAEVADYRFLSLWGGGTFIPQPNGDLRALDSAKIGINLSYFFNDFVNKPPAIINNLVIGPGLATSIVSTPRVLIPTVDINYKFGS